MTAGCQTLAMLTRCATAANPAAVLQAAVIANPTAVQARSNPPYQHDAAVAERTAMWLRTVSSVARRLYAGAYEVFVVRSVADPESDAAPRACNRLIERIAAFNTAPRRGVWCMAMQNFKDGHFHKKMTI